MNERIRELADEAVNSIPDHVDFDIPDVFKEKFAALVAAAEREACAKVCEQSDEEGEGPDSWDWHSKDYASAIRARGEKK